MAMHTTSVNQNMTPTPKPNAGHEGWPEVNDGIFEGIAANSSDSQAPLPAHYTAEKSNSPARPEIVKPVIKLNKGVVK